MISRELVFNFIYATKFTFAYAIGKYEVSYNIILVRDRKPSHPIALRTKINDKIKSIIYQGFVE